MRIEDRKKSTPEGHPLSHFSLGDCVRLVQDGAGMLDGRVYIVTRFVTVCGDLMAINLLDGCHRDQGKFVLEPDAKVVIE